MISIIIPTLNEEQFIKDCIDDVLSKSDEMVEIIVIDAGSTDHTCQVVESIEHSIEHIVCFSDAALQLKKYASLNKGAELAGGDVLVFLDSDTSLPNNFIALIRNKLKNPKVSGGAFEMIFDKSTFLLRIVRWANSIRYNITKRCYGDQAIFCTKEAFEWVGGYPDKIVLEAAHFCSRLMKVGTFVIMREPVITSSRRFIEGGVLRTFLFDLYLLFMDLVGFNVEKSAKQYWKKSR